jgi:uncharacterized LabA/DUF88 family protein
MRRVGVFIDVQNLYLTTKNLYPESKGKLNFAVLKKYLEEDDAIVTFSAFTSYDPENRGQLDFINWLGLNGYRVICKPLKALPDGSVKASMDVEMAIEILMQAPSLDEVVLVTGDGDFAVLVDHLCAIGKVVRILGPERLTSPELIRACHRFENLHGIKWILDVD